MIIKLWGHRDKQVYIATFMLFTSGNGTKEAHRGYSESFLQLGLVRLDDVEILLRGLHNQRFFVPDAAKIRIILETSKEKRKKVLRSAIWAFRRIKSGRSCVPLVASDQRSSAVLCPCYVVMSSYAVGFGYTIISFFMPPHGHSFGSCLESARYGLLQGRNPK